MSNESTSPLPEGRADECPDWCPAVPVVHPEPAEEEWQPVQGWRAYTDALLARQDRIQVLAAMWEQSSQPDAQKAGRILADVLLSGHDCDGGRFDRTVCSTCGARVDDCANDDATRVAAVLPPVVHPEPGDRPMWIEAAAQAIYDHEYDEDQERCACGFDTDGDQARHQAEIAVAAAVAAVRADLAAKVADLAIYLLNIHRQRQGVVSREDALAIIRGYA